MTTVAHHAEIAERIARAVVNGTASMADAREDLSMHIRAAEVIRQADALRAFRAGQPVQAWPASAPWSGF